jgi:type III restriction enzyme
LRDAFEGKERDGKRDFATSDFFRYQDLFMPTSYRDEIFRFVQGAICPKEPVDSTTIRGK